MKHLTEPAEIELYDFPWQAPLTDVEEGCFAARRYDNSVEPEELSVLERKLFEANADDFQWAQSKIKDLPEYLTRYFVTRYISMLEKQGRKEANTYLREKWHLLPNALKGACTIQVSTYHTKGCSTV